MSVIDASVAIKWVYDEPESEAARRVLQSEQRLSAPRLWLIESASVLSRKAREGRLDSDEVAARVGFLRGLPINMIEDTALLSDGLALSLELKHPLYDCLYLALARREQSRLILADYEFAKVARRGGYSDNITELRNYPHP